MSDGTTGFTAEPAPTPAERPRGKPRPSKPKRHKQTDHDHLVELDRAVVKMTELGDQTWLEFDKLKKRFDRSELVLELIADKLGVCIPPRVL